MSETSLATADLLSADHGAEPEAPSGEAQSPPEEPAFTVRCLALGLSTQSRRRLLDHDVELVDEVGEGVDLVLASTRAPASALGALDAAVALGVPVIVVCHPDGEQGAVELVRLGAHAVVAEGNEAAALRIRAGETSGHLLESFATAMDHPWTRRGPQGADPVTALPGIVGMELRLVDLARQAVVPRVGVVEFGPDDLIAGLGPAAGNVLRRRLAVAVAQSATHRGVETFDLGRLRLGLVAVSLPVPACMALGHEVVALVRSFAPAGAPLEAAVGWAGPESAPDAAGVRLLAERALEAARGRPQPVLDAADLGIGAAGSVELSAALRLAEAVDALDPRGSHSERVAALAADLVATLGLDEIESARIGLAARLHAVGKVRFGGAAFDPAHPDHAAASREHPEHGERYLRFSAGAEVAAIVRAHHESWDGSGFPDGLAGPAIPVGARVLGVADRLDSLSASSLPPDEIARILREEAGRSLDPDVVEAALSLLAGG